jgi:hypothetical protein
MPPSKKEKYPRKRIEQPIKLNLTTQSNIIIERLSAQPNQAKNLNNRLHVLRKQTAGKKIETTYNSREPALPD